MKLIMESWREFQKIHKTNEKIYKQYASRLSEESQEVFWNLSEDQKVFVVEDWISQGRPAEHLTESQLRFLKEDIKLDIKVGDVLLGGRFKNKRILVKEIGVDDKGQPTINGRSILKFRIEKLLPDDLKSKKTKEEEKDDK